MREILFRGKSNKTGKWLEGLITKNQKLHFLIQFDPARFPEVVISETVGQFTGIIDKNGTRIFEGDIVEWIDSDENTRIDVVKWVYGGLILCNAQHTVGSYLNNDLLVIGNVFDNTELLK